MFPLSKSDEEAVPSWDVASSALIDIGKPQARQTSINDPWLDEDSSKAIIKVDHSATLDSLVSTAVTALDLNRQPDNNLLNRFPKEIRQKILEYYFAISIRRNYSGHPRLDIKHFLEALNSTPELYQDVIEYYFDQYYMTIELDGSCRILQNTRPETLSLLRNVAMFSNHELWGNPHQYKQSQRYAWWQPEYFPIPNYNIHSNLQIYHAMNLRNLFLSITPDESFAIPYLTKLLRPGPTPLRTLKLNIEMGRDETPPSKDGHEMNRLAWEIHLFVEKKLMAMYSEESGRKWRLRRDWSGQGVYFPSKVWSRDEWGLYDGGKEMGYGPIIGAPLVDLNN